MTTPRLKPAEMPDWPLMGDVAIAAAYVGLAPDKFEDGVAKGIFPPPHWVLGRKLWLLKSLAQAVDALAAPGGRLLGEADALRAIEAAADQGAGQGRPTRGKETRHALRHVAP